MDFTNWENKFEERMLQILEVDTVLDPAHDIHHVRRVAKLAKKISEFEKAQLEVVVPSAWLHDFVNIPKNDPRRKEASKLSAIEAIKFLKEINYPTQYLEEIYHAIECHSFSAELNPRTIEAKVIQDADRLDSLGAIGIARCFVIAGKMSRRIYHPEDPLCLSRNPDDYQFTIDHFRRKILKLAAGMNTEFAKKEAQKRHQFIEAFLAQLQSEVF